MTNMITVQRVLQSEIFKNAKVVAGKNGLNRPIKAVTIAEIPDIAKWLQGGDFVHCVGWFMGEKSKFHYTEIQFCNWVRALDKHGASCLAIKTKRYIDRIPQQLLDLGNEINFPIIELPPNLTQNDTTSAVMEILLTTDLQNKKRNVEAFVNLSMMIATASNTAEIVNIISNYLGNPILLENNQFEYLASTEPDNQEIADLIQKRCNKAFVNKMQEKGFLKEVFCDFIEYNGKNYIQQVYPIGYQDTNIGYLTVLAYNRPLQLEDIELLKNCSKAIALGLIKEHDISYIARQRMQDKFISQLIGNGRNEKHLQYQANLLGINCDVNRTVIAISDRNEQIPNSSDATKKYYLKKQQLLIFVKEFLKQYCVKCDIFSYDNNVMILLDTTTYTRAKLNQLTSLLLSEYNKKNKNLDIIIGVGSQGIGINKYRLSCREALQCIAIVRDFAVCENIMFCEAQGIYGFLIKMLDDKDEANAYCISVLGTLTEIENECFLETLKNYLEFNNSCVRTSKAMFMHVNSVKYRMKHVEEKILVDLNTMNGRSAAWIALKLYYYLKKQNI